MIKRSKFIIRIASIILMLLVLSSLVFTSLFTAVAESNSTRSKVEKRYDIAVVYDNSGSMYNGDMWCQAKYSMEIFASMLNYDGGDKLTIFPMWEVVTDGNASGEGSTQPIVIDSAGDIDLIHNMYTTRPKNTPYIAVKEAYNYIIESQLEEKWLVILSDGEFTEYNRDEKEGDPEALTEPLYGAKLREALLELASEDINVQYLYLGKERKFELDPDLANGLHATQATSETLKNVLISVCNDIFQRYELKDALSGNKLNLDMSMSSLVVFVQGQDAKILSLKNSSGSEITPSLDSGQRTYSELAAKLNAKREPLLKFDKTLAGQVVAYKSCPKGEYELNLSGVDSDKVQVFYEPDVDIEVVMINETTGEEVDLDAAEIPAGKYTITSRLVDVQDGTDVTDSSLMGDVKISTFVKNSTEDYVEYKNGETITFVTDDETSVYVEGKYLNDFTVTTKESDLFPVDWIVTEPETALKVEAEVLQSGDWYVLKNHNSWKPIKVKLTLKGKALTEAEFKSTTVDFSTLDGVKYSVEASPEESAYYVHLGVDGNGKYIEPSTGTYTLEAKATYVDPLDGKANASDRVKFTIERFGKIWEILKWLLIILAIILCILWLIYHKVFPKRITLHPATKIGFAKDGVNQDVGSSFVLEDFGTIIFTGQAKRVTPAYKKKKASAKIKVTNIELGSDISNLKVGGDKINATNKTVTIMNDDVVRFDKGAAKIPKKYKVKINDEF